MKREATKWLLIALNDEIVNFMKDYSSDPNWKAGVNVFPRLEVYSSGSGAITDKSGDSKPVDIVVDVISNFRDESEAMNICEAWQEWEENNPLNVVNFNIDMKILEGTRPIFELGQDNKTINRVIMNYEYTLTQIS